MDFNEFHWESAELDGFQIFHKEIHGCKCGFQEIQWISMNSNGNRRQSMDSTYFIIRYMGVNVDSQEFNGFQRIPMRICGNRWILIIL